MYEDKIEDWLDGTPWIGFAIQQLGFAKECWTVLLMQDTAEFFHWLKEGKQFIIKRSQASQTIYIVTVPWLGNMLFVRQSLGQWILFKASNADLELLRSWLLEETAVSTLTPISQMLGGLSG